MSSSFQPSFKPTADLADILKDKVASCDIQFKQYGAHDHAHGFATTIRCFQDNLLVKQTLNAPSEYSPGILVIDGAASIHTALVGDLIAGAAVSHAWAGIIVLGAIRDAAVLSTLPIAIKALGSNPRKSTQTGSGFKNVPITLGNITINPGDWVSLDADGVVVVPPDQYGLVS